MTESSNTQLPLAVNDQITDALTQSNVKILNDAPAMAMGNLYHVVEMNVNQGVKAGHIIQGNVWHAAQATQALLNYSQSVVQYCMDPFGMYGQFVLGMSQLGKGNG